MCIVIGYGFYSNGSFVWTSLRFAHKSVLMNSLIYFKRYNGRYDDAFCKDDGASMFF